MTDVQDPLFLAYEGHNLLTEGGLAEAARAAWGAETRGPRGAVLVFDAQTGRVVDLDLRGDADAVAARYAPSPAPAAQRGRPKLGVTAREVTLLPRHWDWLAQQPGGASATLRRLVEQARKSDAGPARRDAAYRLMSALAGDLAGFEEASRALFAGDGARLAAETAGWPDGVRRPVMRIAGFERFWGESFDRLEALMDEFNAKERDDG